MQRLRWIVGAMAVVAGLWLGCAPELRLWQEPATCEPGGLVVCYTGPEGTEGVGICATGLQACNDDGVPVGPCPDEQTPEEETCDAGERDEDCDGEVNEEGPSCTCGDGYVSSGEECDDGNDVSTDLCTTACKLGRCGDGIVQQVLGESCDDGGTSDGDPCSSSCQTQAVLEVAAGFFHTCALLIDDTVKCWGSNYDGQLGFGDTVDRGDSPGEMGDSLPTVNLGAGKTAIGLTAGVGHTCALLSEGTVKCWGSNNGGQLGLGDTADRGGNPGEMGDSLPTINIGVGKTAIRLAAGQGHTCALLSDGTVKCWGQNWGGQLGLGDTAVRGDNPGEMGDSLPTVNLGVGKTAIRLAAGRGHTCALLSDGTVKCWGYNEDGQLGLGDTANRGDNPGEMGDNLPAVSLGAGETAIGLVAGELHTCVLLSDGTVKCWGFNLEGALGLGDTANRGDNPGEMGDSLPAVSLGTGKTAVALAAGEKHTCALLSDGAAKCWGTNWAGQLGLGDTTIRGDNPGEMGDSLPSFNIGAGKTAIALAARGRATCALLNDGTVKCWGYNLGGQLGLGDEEFRGDNQDEMGDALPTVKIISDLW